MSRPSNLTVLCLFARVAVQRTINGSTLFRRPISRFRRLGRPTIAAIGYFW
jgi:hypothetical protein